MGPVLARGRLVVVDVETSGLSTRRHRVLQVAAVVTDATGHVAESFSSLVRPRSRWWFRLGPRHIHGLSRRELRAAPRERDVVARLDALIGDSTIVAHNAEFDLAFLREAFARSGRVLRARAHLCTLELSRSLDPDRERSHRLEDLCRRYQVANRRPHDALSDAMATAAVLPFLLGTAPTLPQASTA
jgi:DNA polymerase-3 subunit epsilon